MDRIGDYVIISIGDERGQCGTVVDADHYHAYGAVNVQLTIRLDNGRLVRETDRYVLTVGSMDSHRLA